MPTNEIMGYMVWVVEITARKFFSGDKSMAYNSLRERGVWDFYIANYDITHTLGAEVILDEIGERLSGRDVIIT